ncbi:4-hydroxybenzoyl-CoA thioesterase [Rubrivivax sp. A210]|uniref:GNAT family N-acetyltransferase n=1 Tax=Rubrivivax sp. A210 TaxID=2772301 RepID=UPI001917B21D|nr:GNAT family N-acetyltransferase [Rubrivivax sp. A210]CAD5366204.1 4-hydroxybenzoyl-CoA thioesterase [Rubrivivax sp. A210]
MKRSDFRHLERLRVRWAEVDLQKIVFNGHYLMYVDTAVAGWWRALALPYAETLAGLGGDLFVRKATLDYEGSARFDERLDIGVRCIHQGNSSMRLQAAVFRGERRLVHGELVYVYADPATQTARPLPAPLREAILAFESGAAMVTLQLGDWAALGAQISPVRQAVLVDEQGLPAQLAGDESDVPALHLLALNRMGAAVGCGRLSMDERADEGRVARLARMAALPGVRGAGVGRTMLEALLGAAAERGCTEVRLEAAIDAVPLYSRAGFVAEGPVYVEAGLPHQAMRLRLDQARASKTST